LIASIPRFRSELPELVLGTQPVGIDFEGTWNFGMTNSGPLKDGGYKIYTTFFQKATMEVFRYYGDI